MWRTGRNERGLANELRPMPCLRRVCHQDRRRRSVCVCSTCLRRISALAKQVATPASVGRSSLGSRIGFNATDVDAAIQAAEAVQAMRALWVTLCRQSLLAMSSNAFGGDSMNELRTIPNAVKQTTPTNCFRACVATVLRLPIEDVPAGCDGATWDWDAFQEWLASRNLQAVEMTFGSGGTIYPVSRRVPCILSGKSPRECVTGMHAVVAEMLPNIQGFDLIHDPHASDSWIDGDPTHATFFCSLEL